MTLTHPSHAPRNLTRSGHASWSLTTITYAPTQQPPTALATTSAGFGLRLRRHGRERGNRRGIVASASVSSGIQTSKITWADAAAPTPTTSTKARTGSMASSGGRGTAPRASPIRRSPRTRRHAAGGQEPFDAAGKYPGCSTYHEGRQWYGRTNEKPQTLWSSASAAFNNMNTSSPSKDSDAITRTIASREVNEIRHLLCLNVLLVWTSGAVWKAWAGAQADVMTPANCAVKPQSYEGVSNVPPIATRVRHSMSRHLPGRCVTSPTTMVPTAGPAATCRSSPATFSRHMASRNGPMLGNPHGIVWCVRADGVLLAFTYLKEHDVYAWSRHVTAGKVESVAAVQEADETVLYLSVRRTVGGAPRRFIERMASRGFRDVQAAWCVDCGTRYDGWNEVSGEDAYNHGDDLWGG